MKDTEWRLTGARVMKRSNGSYACYEGEIVYFQEYCQVGAIEGFGSDWLLTYKMTNANVLRMHWKHTGTSSECKSEDDLKEWLLIHGGGR